MEILTKKQAAHAPLVTAPIWSSPLGLDFRATGVCELRLESASSRLGLLLREYLLFHIALGELVNPLCVVFSSAK